MELDERKIKILKIIIKNYMETGEPVGSRTISKLLDLKLSSATIRNEMSDLEEYGYILQPHTSAGRIPSDRGYRFYVDEILRDKNLEIAEFKADMARKVDRIETVLKQLARMMAVNTNYAAMISGPKYRSNKIKFIQISRMEEDKLLVVTVIEGNIIKNKIILMEEEISEKHLLELNLLMNTALNGLSMEDINLSVIEKLKRDAGYLRDWVDKVLAEIATVFQENESDIQIYTSGATNIFKYPELSDKEKASRLIGALEEKERLKRIIEDRDSAGDGQNAVQVYIGEELPVDNMDDCSVVTANYRIGRDIEGTIGIIGPKRMDYERVLHTIKSVVSQLDEELNNEG